MVCILPKTKKMLYEFHTPLHARTHPTNPKTDKVSMKARRINPLRFRTRWHMDGCARQSMTQITYPRHLKKQI